MSNFASSILTFIILILIFWFVFSLTVIGLKPNFYYNSGKFNWWMSLGIIFITLCFSIIISIFIIYYPYLYIKNYKN